MPVKDWFREWSLSLLKRVPRTDWPPLDTEYWDDIRSTLIVCGCPDRAVADEAILRLRLQGFPFPNAMDKPLVEAIQDICKARRANDAGVKGPTDLEAARRDSRDCDDCDGSGMATRFRRRSRSDDPNMRPGDRKLFYCRCRLGRTLKAYHDSDDALKGLIPDLQDYPFLWGPEYRLAPSAAELARLAAEEVKAF